MINKEITPYHAIILEMSRKYSAKKRIDSGVDFYNGAISILKFLSQQPDSQLSVFMDAFRGEMSIIGNRRNN